MPVRARPVILGGMDPERADYFDYDNPPERDLRFDGRTASAVGGLLVIVVVVVVLAVVGLVAFRNPPVP